MKEAVRTYTKVRFSAILFLIYWITKSFYTKSSGGMQIGDYIFAVSFACFFFETARDGEFFVFVKKDIELLYFVGCVAAINLLYFIAYGSSNFLLATAYFIFNFCVVIQFRYLAKNKDFLQWFSFATFACIVIQFAGYFTGQGRIFGTERYMGTFNDPNQLAFFIMTRFFIIYMIHTHLHAQSVYSGIFTLLAFGFSLFLIMQSASTGMFLGLGIFVVCWAIRYCFQKRSFAKALLFWLVLAFAACLLVKYRDKIFSADSYIFSRLEQKTDNMSGEGGLEAYIKDRNLGAFFHKTYYILFGAGEGGWFRFTDVAELGELHSTVLSLLFYYGIIPYILLIFWIVKNIKHSSKLDWCIYIALFIEMLTLVNHRQASLWILFILPSVISESNAARRIVDDKSIACLVGC